MGKTIAFTGHRPNGLYGYDLENSNYDKLKQVLYSECTNQIRVNDVGTFISGGALGLDTLAFKTVYKIKKGLKSEIRNILALPFYNQDSVWKYEDRACYKIMKQRACDIVYVDTLDKYKVSYAKEGEYHPKKLDNRNKYMVDNADIIIAVWNGIKKGGTWNCIKYAQKLGKEIIYINPKEI